MIGQEDGAVFVRDSDRAGQCQLIAIAFIGDGGRREACALNENLDISLGGQASRRINGNRVCNERGEFLRLRVARAETQENCDKAC